MKYFTRRFLGFALCVLSLLLVAAIAEEPARFLILYTDQPAQIYDESGNLLGQSGKPFQPKLPADDEARVSLVVKADGFAPLALEYSAGELRRSRRLPPQGTLSLEREGGFQPLWVVLPLLLGLTAAATWKQHRAQGRTSKKSSTSEFTLGALLGQGATASVYQGTSPMAPGPVAVKILKAGSSDEDMRARFLRSLKATAALDHPNLVKFYATGIDSENRPYIVMEKLEGKSLGEFLKLRPAPSPEEILEIVSPLCQVLHYLHQQDIVHRDVKPDNIFLPQRGGLKLMDLEISRAQDAEDLTMTGVAVGTPFYIAPEQAKGHPGPFSDQYSVGVILFEMLTAKKPYQGKDAVEIITRHIQDPVPSASELNPEVTPLQDAVVRRMMAKRPDSRFSDMLVSLEALQEAFGERADGEETGTVF